MKNEFFWHKEEFWDRILGRSVAHWKKKYLGWSLSVTERNQNAPPTYMLGPHYAVDGYGITFRGTANDLVLAQRRAEDICKLMEDCREKGQAFYDPIDKLIYYEKHPEFEIVDFPQPRSLKCVGYDGKKEVCLYAPNNTVRSA